MNRTFTDEFKEMYDETQRNAIWIKFLSRELTRSITYDGGIKSQKGQFEQIWRKGSWLDFVTAACISISQRHCIFFLLSAPGIITIAQIWPINPVRGKWLSNGTRKRDKMKYNSRRQKKQNDIRSLGRCSWLVLISASSCSNLYVCIEDPNCVE